MVFDIFIALYLIGCLVALGMVLDDGRLMDADKDCNYPTVVKAIGAFIIMLTSWVYVGYRVN